MSSRWLAASCLLSLSACATVIHGTRQNVPIVSRPAGAEVTVNGRRLGQTPVVARLDRKRDQLVRVELTGFQPFQLQLKRHISPAIWWNAWWYFAPLPIDFATGGLFEIQPGVVAATLQPTDADSTQAVARDSSRIPFGSRVRLMLHRADPVEGVFMGETTDSIAIWPRRAPGLLSVSTTAVGEIDRLGISRHRHTGLGAAIGGGAGAMTGAFFVAMVGALNGPFGDKTPQTGDYLAGAAIFALGGAVEGALVGYFIKGDTWEPVPLRRAALQPLIGKGGVGLALQIRR